MKKTELTELIDSLTWAKLNLVRTQTELEKAGEELEKLDFRLKALDSLINDIDCEPDA